jgi:hypothetical protein
MNAISWVVVISAGFVSLLIVGFNIWCLHIGRSSIFPGSGQPAGMAQTLLSSLHITSQILLGVLSIALLCVLMANTILSTEAGLPLVSAVIGYLLGKSFKDISGGGEKKQV